MSSGWLAVKLKKLDVHMKAIDGVNQQTIFGAIATVIAAIVVFTLLVSEISMYLRKDIVSHMVIDSSVGIEAIKIEFDISFDDVACSALTFQQEITRGTLHTHDPEKIFKESLNHQSSLEGCRIFGSIITDKVGGNFRFNVAPDRRSSVSLTVPSILGYQALTPPNISHKINRIMFLSADDTSENIADVNNNNALVQYPLNGQSTKIQEGIKSKNVAVNVLVYQMKNFLYKFFIEEILIMNAMFQGVSLSGVQFKDFVGLVFTYDFYPVMLVMEEKKEHFLEFLCNLCGIVGGIIVVFGLIDRCVYSSAKALIGKKD